MTRRFLQNGFQNGFIHNRIGSHNIPRFTFTTSPVSSWDKSGTRRRSWRSWLGITTACGSAYLVYSHFDQQRQREENIRSVLPHVDRRIRENEAFVASGRHSALVYMLDALPKRAMSRLWGAMHHVPLPVFMRAPIYRLWGWVFESPMHECGKPLHEYTCLAEFFERELIKGSRPIARDAALVSPVDGLVTVRGLVTDGYLNQIKGVSYKLTNFLGELPPVDATGSRNLYYMVIYLAPGDYHRIHAPCESMIEKRVHFPGDLYPVNPTFLHYVPDLFTLNERLVLSGKWPHGFFSMSAVGALNVGSISLVFDPDVKTNIQHHFPSMGSDEPYGSGKGSFVRYFENDGYRCSSGDELGRFCLGSTVVLVFDAPVDFEFTVNEDERVKVGQSIGRIRPSTG